jgi:hypothetical protein
VNCRASIWVSKDQKQYMLKASGFPLHIQSHGPGKNNLVPFAEM